MSCVRKQIRLQPTLVKAQVSLLQQLSGLPARKSAFQASPGRLKEFCPLSANKLLWMDQLHKYLHCATPPLCGSLQGREEIMPGHDAMFLCYIVQHRSSIVHNFQISDSRFLRPGPSYAAISERAEDAEDLGSTAAIGASRLGCSYRRKPRPWSDLQKIVSHGELDSL